MVGKTTVAKLFAGILADLGLLSKGEVVLKSASDFVGSALGESESKTRAILKASEGCVLVIDEAYSLSAGGGVGSGQRVDPFRAAVVDTLVEQIQGVPGEDRCVLLLGYHAEMEAFMKATNPGLERRFRLKEAFIFEDYTGGQACDGCAVQLLRGLHAGMIDCVFTTCQNAQPSRPSMLAVGETWDQIIQGRTTQSR